MSHHDPFQEDYVISHVFVYLSAFEQDYAKLTGRIPPTLGGRARKSPEEDH